MQYRIAYSRALSVGILPRDKMIEVLRSHDVWDEELSKELVSLTATIALKENELEAAEKRENKNEALKAATELAKERGRMWEIMSIQAKPLSHSCEGYAEVVRAEALLASQIYVKGMPNRYWKSYKDYVLERDDDIRATVYTEMMEYQNNWLRGQRQEIMDEAPEQKFFVKNQAAADVLKAAQKPTKKRAAKKKRKVSGSKT